MTLQVHIMPIRPTFLAAGLLLATPLALADAFEVSVKETQFNAPLTQTTVADSDRKFSAKRQVSAFPSRHKARTTSVDDGTFWIFDTYTTLHDDRDYDNYFSTLSITLDADTVYSEAPVYAVVYLGDESEYNSVHVSSVFTIYGDDSSDSLTIDIDLVSGFHPYDYDVLIELYDATNDELVAFSDALDDADLSLLSLESNDYDTPQAEQTVVVVEEHGGSSTAWSLAMLALFAGVRRWQNQKK